MAKPVVTESDVHRACDEMLTQGVRPSQAALVKRLGGSNSTVGPYLKTWNQAQDTKDRERKTPVPHELAAAWAMAANRERSEEESKWAGRIAEQDEQLREVRQDRDSLAERLQALEVANLELSTARDKLAGKVEALGREVEVDRSERQAAVVLAQDAKVELGKATQTIAGLQSRVDDFQTRAREHLAEKSTLEGRAADLDKDLGRERAAHKETAGALSLSQSELKSEQRARASSESRVQALESSLADYDKAVGRAAAAEAAAAELRKQVGMLSAMLQPKPTK